MPSGGAPYPLFAYAALVPWFFFSNSVMSGTMSLVTYRNIVTKTYFPREIVPLAQVGSRLVDIIVREQAGPHRGERGAAADQGPGAGARLVEAEVDPGLGVEQHGLAVDLAAEHAGPLADGGAGSQRRVVHGAPCRGGPAPSCGLSGFGTWSAGSSRAARTKSSWAAAVSPARRRARPRFR